MDDIAIEQLTVEDKSFLEKFTALESLSLNQTGLNSLANLPKLSKLQKLELKENKLSGDELKQLQKYGSTLRTLKLDSNQFARFEDV